MSLLLGISCASASARAVNLPDAAVDTQKISTEARQGDATIVLAGGCFWGVQAVFQHVKGVTKAVAGYAGGAGGTARYEMVKTGTTGHAESVQVTYDPAQITLGALLKIYFAVAHDPTQLNGQGPDRGVEYRSAIFYATPEQRKMAQAYIDQLQAAKVFPDPIVTKLEPLKGFYAAESYHQDYARLHPDNLYILINDAPKVAHLEQTFPELYVKQ